MIPRTGTLFEQVYTQEMLVLTEQYVAYKHTAAGSRWSDAATHPLGIHYIHSPEGKRECCQLNHKSLSMLAKRASCRVPLFLGHSNGPLTHKPSEPVGGNV